MAVSTRRNHPSARFLGGGGTRSQSERLRRAARTRDWFFNRQKEIVFWTGFGECKVLMRVEIGSVA